MSSPRSFQSHLALVSAAISGVILLAFGIAAWKFVDREMRRSLDMRLKESSETIMRNLGREVFSKIGFRNPDENLANILAFVDDPPPLEGYVLFFRGQENEMKRTKNLGWVPKSDLLAKFPKPPKGRDRFDDDDWRPFRRFGDRDREDDDMPRGDEMRRGDRDGDDRRRGDRDGDGTRRGDRDGDGMRRGDRDGDGMRRGDRERGGGRRDRDRRGGGGGRRPPIIPFPEHEHFFTLTDPTGENWRFLSSRYGGRDRIDIFYGYRLSALREESQRVRHYFLIALPIGLAAVGGMSWLVSKKAMRPLARITNTASTMNALELNQRIPITGREYKEFQGLIQGLNEMMGRLEKSFHQATRFTADASHELKTPLALMQAEIESALQNCPAGSKEEQAILNLADETRRLKSIVESLLLLSHVDAGRLRLSKTQVDLSRELEALFEDAQVMAESNNRQFHSELENGIFVQADRTLLLQAFQNLLSNAFKYSEEGGQIDCSLNHEKAQAVLRVGNTGPGIPKEEQKKIFDRFYRIDSARSRKVDGFGLGLNLAFETIKAHGGALSLSEATAERTEFQIILPLDTGKPPLKPGTGSTT